jgi:hypothetical protein
MLLLASAGILMAAEITGTANGISSDNLPSRAIAWKIKGPDGVCIRSEHTTISEDASLPDGQYSYEIIGYLEDEEIRTSKVKEQLNNGRGDANQPTGFPVGVIESGYFQITDGFVVTIDGAEE